MFQAVWGGGKEAQIVFCQHERHHLHPADCLHLLCDLTYRYHLHREEEENHLLGRDGTRRSSSAVHLQEGSWRRICATRRGELEGEREQGGKVPPLLDHHHLHLHLHLLHNHLLGFKRTLHTGRRKRMCIDLNLRILSIFRLVVFVWLMFKLPFISNFHTYINIQQHKMRKQNIETRSFNSKHNFLQWV